MQRLGVREADLKESFARSSGPGGQHVNKVSTAVTLRHQPSGISVTVQDSRSQARNRQLALERLLDALERREEEAKQKTPRRGGGRAPAQFPAPAALEKENPGEQTAALGPEKTARETGRLRLSVRSSCKPRCESEWSEPAGRGNSMRAPSSPRPTRFSRRWPSLTRSGRQNFAPPTRRKRSRRDFNDLLAIRESMRS